jgi:hypothetical protein
MTDWSGTYSPKEFYQKTLDLKSYPSFDHLIQMQLSFYNWWIQADSGFIIRGHKNHPRARVYKTPDGTVFATSDNEACVSFYEYTYHQGGNPFVEGLFGLFKNERLYLSYPIEKDKSYNTDAFLSEASQSGFRLGGATGSPFRSAHQLKLSHYADAAKNLYLKVGPKQRCGIFLSPLNIVLTPKTSRTTGRIASGYYHSFRRAGQYMNLNENDIGETRETLDILHAFLIRDILLRDHGHPAYKAYCEMCNLDFKKQLGRITTIIQQSNDYLFEFKKASANTGKIKYKTLSGNNKREIAEPSVNRGKAVRVDSTRFYITQNHYDELIRCPGCFLYIQVTPRKGNHPKGYYKIPNKIAVSFIESKMGAPNWDKHQNFKQDGIPSYLTDHFIYT